MGVVGVVGGVVWGDYPYAFLERGVQYNSSSVGFIYGSLSLIIFFSGNVRYSVKNK